MNFAVMILPQRVVEALGWTLFHALWQGALAALGFAVVLYFSRRSSARLRYGMGLAALALILLMSAFTFWNHYRAGGPVAGAVPAARSALAPAPAAGAAPATRVAAGAPAPTRRFVAFFSDYFGRHLPLLVTLWLLGVLFLALRFTGGMLYVQRLKYRQSRSLPSPWPERLRALAAKAGLRRPLRLLESLRLRTPVVIGHLKPVLLLPAGLVTGLPADQVEALLAHELAHVMRRDYLVNVVQNLVEILFFFHPGVRWISAAVRQEREHCCDDFAVELCGDPQNYARALARLQVGDMAYPQPALAAAGSRWGALRRITRLLVRSRLGATVRPRLAHDFREGFVSALLLVLGLLAMLKLAAAAAPAGAAEAKPKPAAATKSPATSRFALVSFAVEADARVKLSGESAQAASGAQGTWLVDDSDGQVVWYMDLSPRTNAGHASFSEEVSLGRGSYSWYRPAGWKATAQWQPAGGKGAWTPLTMLVGGERLLRRRDAGDELLRMERHERQLAREEARKDLLRATGEQKLLEEELRKKEAELQAAQGAERELEEGQLKKLQHELQAQKLLAEKYRQEAERVARDKERLQRSEELRAREQDRELELQEGRLRDEEARAREQERRLQAEQVRDLAGAEKQLKEAEKRLRAEEERLRAEEKAIQRFITEFFDSGLLKKGESYRIALSGAALEINGRKQPAAVHEKFKNLYESTFGRKLDAKVPITIVQD